MEPVSRLRRSNAGSRMSALLDEEENIDHFYDELYGGFKEEEDDGDYNCNDDSDGEDIVDSDFSIDENEPADEEDVDQEKKKNKRKLKFGITRTIKKMDRTEKPKGINLNNSIQRVVIPFELDLPFMKPIISSDMASGGKAFVVDLKSNNDPNYYRDFDPPVRAPFGNSGKELTQNELLAEAVITEKINIQSLKDWQKLEEEKSKIKLNPRHKIDVPFIRYHSVAMPLIEEINGNESDETSNDCKSSHSEYKNYSRTFISFSDEETYKSIMSSISKSSSLSTKEMICPVTRMPARYFDPISQLPYANAEAFRFIRHYYYSSLKMYGNTNQTDVKQWIDWSHKNGDKWEEWQRKNSSQIETDISPNGYPMSQPAEKSATRETAKSSACRSSRKKKKF